MNRSCWYFHKLMMLLLLVALASCKKKPSPETGGPDPIVITLTKLLVDGQPTAGSLLRQVDRMATITLEFSTAIKKESASQSINLTDALGNNHPMQFNYANGDKEIQLKMSLPMKGLTAYTLNISSQLQSVSGLNLGTFRTLAMQTVVDSTDKFERVSDGQLLDLVQRKTFAYFWEFGHPVSGMAKERNLTPDVITTGGTGFGIMCIPVAVERKFITRSEGLERMQKIVYFLTLKAEKFHGAFSHWLHVVTGRTIPFSTKDNGADLVETSYLMAGLLTVREYFNSNDPAEVRLVADINALWNAVEWSWFRRNAQQVLYWHWSPSYNWDMNLKIEGWNEALITYILAASSNSDPIPKEVYTNGFARSGAMVTNQNHYGLPLPLGPPLGGPLFLSQYTFLGIDPRGLKDAYADYGLQTVNHSRINHAYCKENPKGFAGYGADCWGLTASDIKDGYAANSPTQDIGVISPTAAITSMPFTPVESMAALKFFYYKMGDRIWGEWGFSDAFSIHDLWFTQAGLAIDQLPQVVMIENHRSGLVWRLLVGCPEIKRGMKALGFSSPYL